MIQAAKDGAGIAYVYEELAHDEISNGISEKYSRNGKHRQADSFFITPAGAMCHRP
jgi:hypothetical protein